nr:Crp/Fnr family transcriptional regulator [Comamonas testosteroni]
MSQIASTFGQPESFAPGSWLRQRRQPLDSVLYLESGSVMLGVGQDSAMRHQLGQVEGPTWLDAAFALQERPSCLDMQAQTAGRIYVIPLARFLSSVAELAPAVQHLLKDLAGAYCAQTELAVSRLAQDAEARCAQWLLNHASPGGNGNALHVTLKARKRLIAAQLGIAPETFSRVLRQLREHGLIAGRGNVIELPKPGALEVLALGEIPGRVAGHAALGLCSEQELAA